MLLVIGSLLKIHIPITTKKRHEKPDSNFNKNELPKISPLKAFAVTNSLTTILSRPNLQSARNSVTYIL